MKKERFIELFKIWENQDCDLKVSLMDWYNVRYPKWDVYDCNSFECIFEGLDYIVDNNFSEDEYNKFLTAWKNEEEIPSPEVFEKLVKLLHEGKFQSFNCAECGDNVLIGSPDDWDDFQGVHQGEGHGELCSSCYSLYRRLKEFADD